MTRLTTAILFCGALGGAFYLGRTFRTAPVVRAQNSCTASSFQGAYGYTFQGTVTEGDIASPFASSGRLVSDGDGKFTGAESATSDAEVVRRIYNGGYTVNPDCTGTAILNDNSGAVNNFDFTIVEGGRKLLFIRTDPGTALTGIFTPQ